MCIGIIDKLGEFGVLAGAKRDKNWTLRLVVRGIFYTGQCRACIFITVVEQHLDLVVVAMRLLKNTK